MHARALRLPAASFRFVGVRPEEGSRFDADSAERGEREAALEPFLRDPYGCAPRARGGGPLLAKRQGRDPFARTIPYELSCPELRPLLRWCGPALFNGSLPWLGPGE